MSLKQIIVLIVVLFNFAACSASTEEGIAAFYSHDDARALAIFQPLANKGNPVAQYYLGFMNSLGKGVKENKKEGIRLITLSAESGYVEAQYYLGTIYFDGSGVDKNYELAYKWSMLAGKQGDVSSLTRLGDMYAEGLGVKQSGNEALKWYKAAAELDKSGFSQRIISKFYSNGKVVDKNPTEAFKWMKQSAELSFARNNEYDYGDSYKPLSKMYREMYRSNKNTDEYRTEAIKWQKRYFQIRLKKIPEDKNDFFREMADLYAALEDYETAYMWDYLSVDSAFTKRRLKEKYRNYDVGIDLLTDGEMAEGERRAKWCKRSTYQNCE